MISIKRKLLIIWKNGQVHHLTSSGPQKRESFLSPQTKRIAKDRKQKIENKGKEKQKINICLDTMPNKRLNSAHGLGSQSTRSQPVDTLCRQTEVAGELLLELTKAMHSKTRCASLVITTIPRVLQCSKLLSYDSHF